VAHHRQVVADEEVGQTPLALQVFHDVEHLRLHAHIQGAGGFVADQKVGLGGQGAGNRDALTLAARELVRVFHPVQRRQAHRLQQAIDPLAQGLRRGFDAVFAQGLGHDVLDLPARVEAGVGVLKNHLDAAAQLATLRGLEGGVRVLPVKFKATACGCVQAHQQAGHRAFAAARFAHQGQRLTTGNVKRHAVHGMQQLARLAL